MFREGIIERAAEEERGGQELLVGFEEERGLTLRERDRRTTCFGRTK